MSSKKTTPSPPPDHVPFPARQAAVLEHALQLFAGGGNKSLTTARLARAARCSKESLYKWFGNREDILCAMIIYQASKVRTFYQQGQRLTAGSLHHHFFTFVQDLLDVLGGDISLTLNRLAISGSGSGHSELRALLLECGRGQIERRAKVLIDGGQRAGLLRLVDADLVYRTLYGLAVSDLHVHMLLGGAAPQDSRSIAGHAVRAFMRLYGTDPCLADAPSVVDYGPETVDLDRL